MKEKKFSVKINKPVLGRLLSLICVLSMLFMFCGCEPKIYETTRVLLKERFSEDFIIHSKEFDGNSYDIYCSPVSNPEIYFTAWVNEDNSFEGSDYISSCAAYYIKKDMEDDLKKLFPRACYYMEAELHTKEEIKNVSEMSFEELMDAADIEASSMDLTIFYSEEGGSIGDYEAEWEFFTNTVKERMAKKRALPLTVEIYKVKDESVDKMESFLKEKPFAHMYINDNFKRIFGIQFPQYSDYRDGKSIPGNPPTVSACFNENFYVLREAEEYIRRREIQEAAPITLDQYQ